MLCGAAGGKEDEATLERLRSALQLFEGTHPFHNYTKRRLYRAEAREGIKAKVLSCPPCVDHDRKLHPDRALARLCAAALRLHTCRCSGMWAVKSRATADEHVSLRTHQEGVSMYDALSSHYGRKSAPAFC